MTVSNEVEETVLSFEKQLEFLSDENDKLKIKVKNLEEEIYLLKEQNAIYKKIINQNNLSINIEKVNGSDNPNLDKNLENNTNNIKNKDKVIKIGGSDYPNHNKNENIINKININNYKNEIENIGHDFNYKDENKININTSFLTPSNSNDKIKDNNFLIRPKKVTIGDCLYVYYENNFNKQSSKNENNPSSVVTDDKQVSENKTVSKKIRPERDKNLPILDRFKVKVFKDEDLKDSEVLQFVGSEDCFLIEYQYKIANKIHKKVDDITIDDVINFKIKYEGLRNTYTRRTELRRLITRCRDLFEKYGKRLCKFKITLYHLKIMSDDEWEEWVTEFDKLFNKINIDKNICKHQYKNGNICGKISCKIKHKSNI